MTKRRAGSQNRESDCQFDYRPEKVENRPDLFGCRRRATYRWKAFDEGYNFASDRVAIEAFHKKLCALKVPGVPVGGISGLPRESPRSEKPFGCGLPGESQSILYGGRWWLPPSPGRGVSCGPKCPWLVPTPKGVPECELTTLWFVLDAESSLIY
jgi:hypothetical protein